jgi:2-hydroxycyclohexanecarboxyl-CoA dehydrogenase
MRGLDGQTVIVTGGGGGIGGAACRRLAAEGSRVAVCDIDGAAAAATATAITDAGGSAEAVTLDITDYDAVTKAVVAV